VARVREEVWPAPEDAEEVHEALRWMGYVTREEGLAWQPRLEALSGDGRVVCEQGQWRAVDGPTDPKVVLRGRMEALGPIVSDDPLLYELERDGGVLRVRFDGRDGWCDRRQVARIHRCRVPLGVAAR
jgi:ATP-dependent Lhr-like helicase